MIISRDHDAVYTAINDVQPSLMTHRITSAERLMPDTLVISKSFG